MMNLRTMAKKKHVKAVSLTIAIFFVLSIVALTLTQSNASAAPTNNSNVGVVNFQMAVTQCPDFAKAQETMKTEGDAAQKEFEAKIATLSSDKEKQDYAAQTQQRMQQREQQLLAPILDKVNAAVKAVADAKGLSVVLDKGQVVYGGNDITADVLSKLGVKQ